MAVPSFSDGVAIFLMNPQGELHLGPYHAANQELLASVQLLRRRGTYKVSAGIHRVMRTGRSELHPKVTPEWIVAHEADHDLLTVIQRFGPPSFIYVPIILGGRPFAVISFSVAPPRVYNEYDLIVAEELARRASTAMHNAELFHKAKTEKERAQEEVMLRERLVAIVGHDLRNPLSSIGMAARVLGRHPAVANDELFDVIQRCVDRMTRMIDQILDFARIRSGQSFDLRIESADVRSVSQSVIDEFRVSKPGQEITLGIEGETFALIDSDRIAQLLSNLIGNAIQHGKRGAIDVTLCETEPNAVAIEVHNFGPAIPAAEQAQIFDAFHRGGNDTASIGLGLFIAKEIVRAHGGSIAVRSPDRDGTTFCVVLPRGFEATA